MLDIDRLIIIYIILDYQINKRVTTWGKVLTIDQLKRRGMTLVNRCFMCEEDEENIDHLLIHYKSAKMLWNLFFVNLWN